MAKYVDEYTADMRHAKRRLRTRYKKSNPATYVEAVVREIDKGNYRRIYRQSKSFDVIEVRVNGESYFPVYNKSRKTIVTFLSFEQVAINMMAIDTAIRYQPETDKNRVRAETVKQKEYYRRRRQEADSFKKKRRKRR